MNFRKSTVSKAGAPKANYSPVGVVGTKQSSGIIEEEFLRDLRWPEAGKIYQEMMSNDAVVGACLYLIETIIRRAKWTVAPATQEAADVEAAQFLESCMNDMQDQTWDDFICDVLSMLPYGFSFHEIVYKVRRGPLEKNPKYKSDFSDGKIGWQCLPIRSQATMSEWEIDVTTGAVTGFIQDPSLVGLQSAKVTIPIEGNLLFKTKANRGNPEGWSILRRAYRSWFFKRYIEELEGIGIERNLAGIPVLSPPADLDLFNKENKELAPMRSWASELVTNLRQDKQHGIVLPGDDWKLSLLSSDGANSAVNTDTAIRRHESRMAMAMLADVVMMGGDRTGSFALAETKKGLFISSLEAITKSIAATLNRYAVPKLFALNNMPVEKLPKIVATSIDPPTPKDVALLMRSMKVNIGTNHKLFNFVMDLMQAPELTDEEFEALVAVPEDDSAASDLYQDTVDNDFKQSDSEYSGRSDL